MVQIEPEPTYDHTLVERVIMYLETRDPRLFPFTAQFTPEQRRAFIHDLREALADLQDSGSARKTSATGYIMRDRRLHETVREWAAANGGWPSGSDPRDPDTALGASTPEDEIPGAAEVIAGSESR
ncbi:MAG: hypothetical protein KatS3mg059_0558 [Thermomicrobiales bacterium]|nr:MAG: hypothetical protein KatS3mg059_0558 [Thermomicrobiales bacterium]